MYAKKISRLLQALDRQKQHMVNQNKERDKQLLNERKTRKKNIILKSYDCAMMLQKSVQRGRKYDFRGYFQ